MLILLPELDQYDDGDDEHRSVQRQRSRMTKRDATHD